LLACSKEFNPYYNKNRTFVPPVGGRAGRDWPFVA
jgi:hypothetical protein